MRLALHTLSTHPEYQGRGCAGMLLQWGVEKADAAGRKCYLEATPAAYGAYRKYGWETVDEIMIDLQDYQHRIKVMMREPKVEEKK